MVVQSVEHILSACFALGVDNLVVEINGDEPPACGGNAEEFARALLEAGIEEQNAERPLLRIEGALTVNEGEATIVATAAEEGLSVEYLLEFESRSLGKGVTEENAFILFKDGSIKKPLCLTDAELRFPDECARHKLLDLLGDLALANVDVEGRIMAIRSGHRVNAAFATRLCSLLEQQQAGPEQYLDIREIQRVLPHRYPFLMVDRIIKVEEDKVVGLKNVSMNEHFFQGHYPDYPIMPGVLQLEALAQVAGVLLLRKLEHTGKLALLVGLDSVKLRRRVEPGDQLLLEAEVVRAGSRTAQVNARATVDGHVSCEAEMKFMLVDAEVM